MFDERLVKRALAVLKYQRVKPMVFQASWSTTDVDHFLYLEIHGMLERLSVEFGFRNSLAQDYGVRCINKYRGFLQFKLQDPRVDCLMRFPLGLLAGRSPVHWSIYISELSITGVADKLSSDIQEYLMPMVRDVTNIESLLEILLEDSDPIAWFRTSGGIRAAKIAYLAHRLGMGPEQIRALLIPHQKSIKSDLGRAIEPKIYIEKVIADVTCAQQT